MNKIEDLNRKERPENPRSNSEMSVKKKKIKV